MNGNKLVKIVHLMHDEKFLDASITMFENEDNCQNLYFVLLPPTKNKASFIKSPKIEIAHSAEDIIGKIGSSEKPDGIIVHFYDERKAQVLIKIKKLYPSVLVIWSAWGGDFYGVINYELYQKETIKLIKQKKGINKTIIKSILQQYNLFKFQKKILGLSLVDFCSTIVPNEFSLLVDIKEFRAKQVQFSYADFHMIDKINDKTEEIPSGNNILIGNSASTTNNHLDIFKQIADQQTSIQGKLIVPLSYGSPWYKDAIIEKGIKQFSDSFCPLEEYLNEESYYQLISSCGVAIFNHNRQQGVGNINAMIVFGARVYLSHSSPVYRYYKEIGLNVYSLQEDFKKYEFEKLSSDQIIWNRKIMAEIIWNKVKIQSSLTDFIESNFNQCN